MAIHRLLIDDFVTADYGLVAIHSSLEDYRLAYFINRQLELRLEKSPCDIGVKVREGESSFSRYTFEDPADDSLWNLIQNKNRVISAQGNTPASLFNDTGLSISTSVYLMPEFKKVDYVLKIENTHPSFAPEAVVDRLLGIKHVTTAYAIDHKKLKSKNNLIF